MIEYCPICQSVTVHSEGRCVVCGTRGWSRHAH